MNRNIAVVFFSCKLIIATALLQIFDDVCFWKWINRLGKPGITAHGEVRKVFI